MTDKTDYEALATWAEDDMRLSADSATALRGAPAATKGRVALEAALGGAAAVERAMRGGRPPLDPGAAPGAHARSRTVRLTTDLDHRLDELVAAQRRRPSDIMREALADYLENHRAG